MKKGLIFVVLVAMVFVLTGCGNKPSTLTCTMKVSSVNVELTANFAGKKVTAMGMKYDMDVSNYSDSTIETISKQDYCSTVQKSMPTFTLTDCKQNVENKHVIVTSGIDLDKMDKSQLVGSPEETKKALEAQGYTCTLK